MISYFIYTIISLGCSYALYFLLLRKQKTFQFNRFFLIGSLLLCLLAPLLEIELFNAVPSITEIPFEVFTDSAEVSENMEDVVFGTAEIVNPSKNSPLLYIYLAITLFLVFRFLKNIFQLYHLSRGEFERFGKLKLIKNKDSEMMSSFFNYMFISKEQTIKDEDYLSIIQHETVHFEELHSIDIIIVELLICAFWFNPFIWLYKSAMLQNHEYIADEKSVFSGIDIENYSNTIINLGHKHYRVPLTSGFNFIKIKNRIIMLHQSKSSLLNRTLKISSALLLFAGIFVFSCTNDEVKEPLLVVIDAGHGGKDCGNISEIMEKDVILSISNLLASYSNEKVKIILTRESDAFLSLKERSEVINAANADLMISLHCNAHTESATNGIEAYYNDKNEHKEVSYDYSKLLIENQSQLLSARSNVKSANFYLLKNVDCPAIYLELGFLTNENDRAILSSTAQQKEIAQSLFESLMEIQILNPR